MKIEQLSNTTVKINLSKSDMDEYDVSFDTLDSDNHQTKSMLIDLIEYIKEEFNIDFCYEKLFIEAFSNDDDQSCILYVSILGNKIKPNSNISSFKIIVAEFDDFESLKMLSKQLLNLLGNSSHTSSLYYKDDKLRLICKSNLNSNEKLNNLVQEYGEIIGEDELDVSITREHYICIEFEKALEKLQELLSE